MKYNLELNVQKEDDMYHPTIADAPYTHTEVVHGGADDNKWLMSEAECDKPYKLFLDITEGEETMVMKEFIPYANIYLVGDATPSGWDLGTAVSMTVNPESPYIFTWTGSLSAGEMKFSCDKQGDWNGAWFMPDETDKTPTGELEEMLFVDKSDAQYLEHKDVDMKWKVGSAGSYKITLNQLKETISFVKQ